MAQLYANECFDRRVVDFLRELGHDVLTTVDAGKAGQQIPDDQVLIFATAQDRAVVTFNRRDFINLHKRSSEHAGVIVCTEDSDHAALARRIHDAIGERPLAGLLLRINRPRTQPSPSPP